MAKTSEIKPENHTEHPFDNGAIDAIVSVASVGTAVGAALGVTAGISGLVIGAAIGGTVSAVGSLMIAEKIDHPTIPPKKIA